MFASFLFSRVCDVRIRSTFQGISALEGKSTVGQLLRNATESEILNIRRIEFDL
jgi:hypothetical protein